MHIDSLAVGDWAECDFIIHEGPFFFPLPLPLDQIPKDTN